MKAGSNPVAPINPPMIGKDDAVFTVYLTALDGPEDVTATDIGDALREAGIDPARIQQADTVGFPDEDE